MPEDSSEDAGVKFRKEYLSEKVAELAKLLIKAEGREVSESEAVELAVCEYLAWLHDAEKEISDEITVLYGEYWAKIWFLGTNLEKPDK